jgi:hypothetical protein
MFRMIRRAPWIALGAAGVYYLDTASGAARRTAAAERARTLVERGRERWQATLEGAPSAGGGGTVDAPLAPSVSDERVRTRADGPQAEESAAGVPAPARGAMAKTILEDSEARVTDRAGTSDESRRSEDTVEPLAI